MRSLESFADFQRRCVKLSAKTVGEVFGWQLVQIAGCGPLKARKILNVYPTNRALARQTGVLFSSF